MKNEVNEQEKILLTIASLVFGVFAFILFILEADASSLTFLRTAAGLGFGLGAALMYALAGLAVVRLYGALRSWAYKGDVLELNEKEKLRLAAFWPITFVTSLVVYLFIGVINRRF